MRHDLKIKTIDVVVDQFCNRIGKEAWADLRRELVEEKFTSTNTGSPKLPPYGEFEAWCRNASIHVSVCKPIYEWFGRKLRAGA